jgi:hypothetical protein
MGAGMAARLFAVVARAASQSREQENLVGIIPMRVPIRRPTSSCSITRRRRFTYAVKMI